MANKPTLQFEKGKTYKVTLMYDGLNEGVGKNGKAYSICGVKYNDTEYSFFVNDFGLKAQLQMYSKGDVIEITDNDTSDVPYKNDFSVVSVSSNKPLDQMMRDSNNTTEKKIETWAAMKVAAALPECDLQNLQDTTTTVLSIFRAIVNDQDSKAQAVLDKVEDLF